MKTLIKLAQNAASQVMLDSARAETNQNAAAPGPRARTGPRDRQLKPDRSRRRQRRPHWKNDEPSG